MDKYYNMYNNVSLLKTDKDKKDFFVNYFYVFAKSSSLTEEQNQCFLDLTKKYYNDLSITDKLNFRCSTNGCEWFIQACDSPEFLKKLVSGKESNTYFTSYFPALENKVENFNDLLEWKFSNKESLPIPKISKNLNGYGYLKSSLCLINKLNNKQIAIALKNKKFLNLERKIVKNLLNLSFNQKLLKKKDELLKDTPIFHNSPREDVLKFFKDNPRWSNLREFKDVYWNIITEESPWDYFKYFTTYNEMDNVKYPLNELDFFNKALGEDVVKEMLRSSVVNDSNYSNVILFDNRKLWQESMQTAYIEHFIENHSHDDFIEMAKYYNKEVDDNDVIALKKIENAEKLKSVIAKFISQSSLEIDSPKYKYSDKESAMAHSVVSGYLSLDVADVYENPLQIILRMEDRHKRDFKHYLLVSLLRDQIDFSAKEKTPYSVFNLTQKNGEVPFQRVVNFLNTLSLEENIEIHQKVEKDLGLKLAPHPYLKKMMIGGVLSKDLIGSPSDENKETTGFKL